MRKTLVEEAKLILERDRTCSFCGFNMYNRTANLKLDCIPSGCSSLIRKMKMLKPYYDTKISEITEIEKSVNEQIADRQQYIYSFYCENCKKDGEEPLSYDLWLRDRAIAKDERVIPQDGAEDRIPIE